MQYPLVHLNGTSREELSKRYAEAEAAMRQAINAVAKTEPHGRDYYPIGPNAASTAMSEHLKRLHALGKVHDDMVALFLHVEGIEEPKD